MRDVRDAERAITILVEGYCPLCRIRLIPHDDKAWPTKRSKRCGGDQLSSKIGRIASRVLTLAELRCCMNIASDSRRDCRTVVVSHPGYMKKGGQKMKA